MTAKKLASIISVVLGPQLWLPILLVAIVSQSGLERRQIAILLPSLVLLQIVVPSGFVLLKLKNNQIGAWDLPNREERYPFLVVSIVSYLISLIVIYMFGNAFLLNLSAISLLLLVLIAATTWYWKISLHASLNTAGALILNFLYDWRLPWLFLTVPIIIWARLALKRHTPAQLLAGVILSGGVVLLFLRYLGYI